MIVISIAITVIKNYYLFYLDFLHYQKSIYFFYFINNFIFKKIYLFFRKYQTRFYLFLVMLHFYFIINLEIFRPKLLHFLRSFLKNYKIIYVILTKLKLI